MTDIGRFFYRELLCYSSYYMAMRFLYVLRHAKSAWNTDAASDFQRPLAKRGIRNARQVGHWMAEHAMIPEYIISSPALRAWQTVTLVCTQLGIEETNIEFNSVLYLADVDTLLSCIRRLPENRQSILLVGHNPGLEDLVAWLTSGEVPHFDDGKILPTATLAAFSMNVSWEQLDADQTRLEQIKRAR
jgi:phosphohistidine phosphatase